MKITTLLLLVFLTNYSIAQKKELDHTVYNDWKSLSASKISDDGLFSSYEINPHRGDGFLYLYNNETAKLDSFPRAFRGSFSEASDFFVFQVKPEFDTLRKCELEKVDKKKWPKDSLFVVRLRDMKTTSFPMLKKMDVQPNGNWMVFSIDSIYKKVEPKVEAPGFFKKVLSKLKKKEEAPKEPKVSSKGNIVYLFQPSTEKTVQLNNVISFEFSENGDYLLYTEHKKVDKEETFHLKGYDLKTGSKFNIDVDRTSLSHVKVSATDKYLAYLASSDTTKIKNNTFVLYDLKENKKLTTLDSTSVYINDGFSVSENQSFVFTENEKFLFLGIREIEKEEAKDTLLAKEKAKLDIWHYEEKRNQPMQLKQLGRDKKATDLYALNLGIMKLVQIEEEELEARPDSRIVGNYIFATDDSPYESTFNWDFPFSSDHYRVSLVDGSKKLIKKKVRLGGSLSPSGDFYTYFSFEKEQHYVVNIQTGMENCVSCSRENVNWQTDGNGSPHVDYPFGVIGWDEKEENLFVQSEFDIWSYNVVSKDLISITNEQGEEDNIEFRMRKWDNDSVYISPSNVYLKATDMKTKDEMVYSWKDHGDHSDIIKWYQTPHMINQIVKSKSDDRILLRKSNVTDYADLFLLDVNFKNETRISQTNPQQSQYNWATVELMDYTSYDGQKLQGLLYKPENFDANKSYPLLVYFYELYTDRLNRHYSPRPTASIIYPTEYASAGYVVLIPDIRYKVGHPAKSAYNCIMASTDEALRRYSNIDSSRMGLQGQSWGGYQTAQLITMTTRYKAAMAGAPVANMFSAYGGIRWGSGMNRQFQYERTQSRIGATIWEAPALYVENSPLFHLPNVSTPLLIMHNDGDGAVPWYQGIELFMGMKRLGKPCWMLNYNGDDHNLMKNANRMDLSIRMRQFFDYYLLEKPAPRWLIEGLPAIDKGKDYRLDLMEE